MRRSQPHIVGRMALQDIFINGARAETVHLSDGTRTVRALPLYPIKSQLRSVDIRHRVVGGYTRCRIQVARPKTDCLVVNTDVHHRLQTLKCTAKVVRMFTLEFVLDPFPVRRVPNQRQNRADALHKQSALSGLGIIKCSLSEIFNEKQRW